MKRAAKRGLTKLSGKFADFITLSLETKATGPLDVERSLALKADRTITRCISGYPITCASLFETSGDAMHDDR
jgi:hypothetical protein